MVYTLVRVWQGELVSLGVSDDEGDDDEGGKSDDDAAAERDGAEVR